MSYKTYLKIRNFPLTEKQEYLRPTCIRLSLVYEEVESWWGRICGGGNKLSIWKKGSWEYLWNVIKFPFTDLSDDFLLGKKPPSVDRNDPLRKICVKYFEDHPEKKQAVIEKGKRFDPDDPTKDWLPSEKIQSIKQTLLREEELYFKLLKRSEDIVKKLHIESLTGKDLCTLHHTHGIDPIMIEDILDRDLPQKLHDDYLLEYEKHRQTGRDGLKKEEIKVETHG